MAYTHGSTELLLAATAALTSAADIVTKKFLLKTQVFMVALEVTTAATVTAPVVDVYWRPTAGSDTGRVLIKRITRPLAEWTVGKWIYAFCDQSGNAIRPGGDMVVEVSTPATAGAANVYGVFNNSWEHPSNLPVMVESA